MKLTKYLKPTGWLLAGAAALLLSGCDAVLLDPKGSIGVQERNLIYTAFGLMLIVVIPVIVMTFLFAWKYRATNKEAKYTPNWAHSYKIEAVVWLVPLAIVVFLSILSWKTSHELDPFKPLDHPEQPLVIEAVSMDWKWLFIYPEQGIASVNEIAIPVNRPVQFKITSESVMNTLSIPALGGMIYAMSGMQSQLHLIADHPGEFEGRSANYSGAGFSDMIFTVHAVPTAGDFDAWVNKVKQSGGKTLDQASYTELAKPSEKQSIAYYSTVEPDLFRTVIKKFMKSDFSKQTDHVMDMSQHGGQHGTEE